MELKKLPRKLVEIAVIALLYMGATQIGYALAFLDTIVSPVWPPAGLGLAAVLLRGYHAFLGIFLGAVLGQILNSSDLTLAAGTSVASATGPVINAFLISRVIGQPDKLFKGVRNVLLFLVAGIPLGALASAVMGTSAVYLRGYGSEVLSGGP